MSADNWRVCPKCTRSKAADVESAKKRAEQQYGKVPVAQYERLCKAVSDIETKDLEETLREDYVCRVGEDAKFEVDYVCSCDVCDFRFSFNHHCDAPMSKE